MYEAYSVFFLDPHSLHRVFRTEPMTTEFSQYGDFPQAPIGHYGIIQSTDESKSTKTTWLRKVKTAGHRFQKFESIQSHLRSRTHILSTLPSPPCKSLCYPPASVLYSAPNPCKSPCSLPLHNTPLTSIHLSPDFLFRHNLDQRAHV